MILICDVNVSERALNLRRNLFSRGFPCACCGIPDIGKYLPAKLIVTFTDMFDSVRRTPYDDIFVIAIGTGFVNSVLNAARALNEEELSSLLLEKLCDGMIRFPFGIKVTDSLFISDYFVEINGKAITLTQTEFMIFKYLYAFAGKGVTAPTESVYHYCFGEYKISEDKIPNNIAVNVKKINDKFAKALPEPVIKSKRGKGYYFTEI